MSDERAAAHELDTTRFAPEHDAAGQRFIVRHPAGDSVLSYRRPEPDVIDLRHTVVFPKERGKGTGESLVRAALAFAREQRLRVIPTCPYVAEVLAEHPEEREGLTVEAVTG